jgi:hypothetical protein
MTEQLTQEQPRFVDDPIRSRLTIDDFKELYKVDELRHAVERPGEFRNFVKEVSHEQKERSDAAVSEYKLPNQEELLNKEARFVNLMHAQRFLDKLRRAGIKFLINHTKHPDKVGLFCMVPGKERFQFQNPPIPAGYEYIGFMQVPYMPEWSILRLDEHGLPNGEEFRGWRNLAVLLIQNGVLTEEQAHSSEMFGEPTLGIVSRRYRESLYNFRNRN